MSRMSELAADAERVAKFSEPLLEQAADRLSARYGTPKVVGFIGDDAFAVVMREDGRWARYEHGKGWTELPRLDAKVFACPCTEEIGPCPACAEGAVDD